MDDRQTIRFVENFLHHREFEIVANAPAPTPHHSLIKKLRGSGRAGHFDSDALAIVARILVSESLLTDSEAKWLETAGPAWMTSEEAGDQP